jgi:negative regulator of flagellin synthesis FlgM
LLLSRLEDALQSSPAVDAERVRAVRDAIASGAYEIDPGVIAEKIIRLEQELSI